MKQETVSGSGISWAICKSTHRGRQITMPAPHHSILYRPDALPAIQPCQSTIQFTQTHARMHTHTHTHPFNNNGPFSRTTRMSRYQKGKPIWILLKQQTVSGSGISWAICKSGPCSNQTTTPAPHHSVFYRPDALPAAQPTASKH